MINFELRRDRLYLYATPFAPRHFVAKDVRSVVALTDNTVTYETISGDKISRTFIVAGTSVTLAKGVEHDE